MNEKELQKQLQINVKKKLQPLFDRYSIDFEGIDSTLKWKPVVLIIGNYSSGKSTLINEIIGQDIQRTGQAPTDDSFTIITSDTGVKAKDTPGSTLVNNENLPFKHFKQFGERFISHVTMKQIECPVLENMVIIDSPGMLDATSEKDRGYNYTEVLGEFAKMADLIVLMFDPHKAGTIKESYEVIRNTLPEKSGEHRIVFAMSRIDECENLSDLTRSYGTLCWNMSQMTGRKDIPHIYLTYAPKAAEHNEIPVGWPQERQELIAKIMKAPSFRINHILEDIDRKVNELQIVAEAVSGFVKKAKRTFWKFAGLTFLLASLFFLLGDVLTNYLGSFPKDTLLKAIENKTFSLSTFLVPSLFALGTFAIGLLSYSRLIFVQVKNKSLAHSAELVTLASDYRKNLWLKMEGKAKENISRLRSRDIWKGYGRSFGKIKGFLERDVKKYYENIAN